MINVLDHGYVKFIECWGSDERVIEAARMSTDKGFNGWGPIHESSCHSLHEPTFPCTCTPKAGDEKLLAFLYKNKHMTPFEMGGIVIEVMAPIFVFREWHRHRTQSYNEMSARYIPLPNVNYVPSIDRILNGIASVGTNRQAAALNAKGDPIEEPDFENWLGDLESAYKYSQVVYERGLKLGVPKELARLPVPVARYSRMRASANLRNWLQFLTLRQAPNAQWEIRQYAEAVGILVSESFPRTYALFKGEPK